MTGRRRLTVLLSLVLATGARVVYALPAQVEAELRAVSCCTQHTGRPATVPDARECCAISSDADAPAVLGAAAPLPSGHAIALPAGVTISVPPLSSAVAGAAAAPARDGPPRYLVLRTIRR